jgi:branched-chain amino acid aminotransferase
VVIGLAKDAGVPFREMSLTRHDVYVADEVFLTGTAAEVIAVTKVDERVIGSGKQGPVTRRLRELFLAAVRA